MAPSSQARMALPSRSKLALNLGSPALSMMTADSRPGPTAKSRQIDAPPSCRRVWFIESAEEPELAIDFNGRENELNPPVN
jgi:hypothetical protein